MTQRLYKDYVEDMIGSVNEIEDFVDGLSLYPWRQIAGMRDKLTHEYFGIDLEIVWQTIKQDLPKLKPLINKLQKALK